MAKRIHPAKKLGLGALAAASLVSPVISNPAGAPPPTPAKAIETLPNGCGMDGSEQHGSAHAAENNLKNRYTFPAAGDFLPSLTVPDMIKANNEDAFDTTKAATVEGYIGEVKAGGVESCNCHAQDDPEKDTHIYVYATLADMQSKQKSRAVIVEVTPRIRTLLKAVNKDWSTAQLIKELSGKHVRIAGWLFYDGEHENAAENIAHRQNNWRATCWEIHPVTDLSTIP